MEAVGIALVVFGPLLGFLLLVIKATRKLMPNREAHPPWRRQDDVPPRPGEASGDREPRRPLTPSRSGAVAFTPPESYNDQPHEVAVLRIEPQAAAGDDHRLAG